MFCKGHHHHHHHHHNNNNNDDMSFFISWKKFAVITKSKISRPCRQQSDETVHPSTSHRPKIHEEYPLNDAVPQSGVCKPFLSRPFLLLEPPASDQSL